MKVIISPFSVDEAPQNPSQQRIQDRLKGLLSDKKIVTQLKQGRGDFSLLKSIRGMVEKDPDAVDEIIKNGLVSTLQSILQNRSRQHDTNQNEAMDIMMDDVAEFLIEIQQVVCSGGNIFQTSNCNFFDEQTRPKPYWIHFDTFGSLLIRYMSPTNNRGGHGDRPNFEVGFTLWGASLVLCKLIILEKIVLKNKIVLELGSGLGLTGLAAAKFGHPLQVLLTDFHPGVVQNCKFNIELNGLEKTCLASKLDWADKDDEGEQAEIEMLINERAFDCIIGSDVICQVEDCFNIRKMLDRYLALEGEAIFCLGSSESRYGVSQFTRILSEDGDYIVTVDASPESGNIKEWVSSSNEDLDFLVGHARSYSIYHVRRSSKI
jgi:predicted nicotinamide N-methyase